MPLTFAPAPLDGDEWVIIGEKNASRAPAILAADMITMVVTNSDAPKHLRQS